MFPQTESTDGYFEAFVVTLILLIILVLAFIAYCVSTHFIQWYANQPQVSQAADEEETPILESENEVSTPIVFRSTRPYDEMTEEEQMVINQQWRQFPEPTFEQMLIKVDRSWAKNKKKNTTDESGEGSSSQY